ncbi:MAG: hypothetical protein ABSH48_15325 [Verrucomicrobiota bacterium]|jgi:hypothetical protein
MLTPCGQLIKSVPAGTRSQFSDHFKALKAQIIGSLNWEPLNTTPSQNEMEAGEIIHGLLAKARKHVPLQRRSRLSCLDHYSFNLTLISSQFVVVTL